MRNLFLLSFKNIFRYTRRTIITASAIAVGMMMYIILDGLLIGAEIESERNMIQYETSHAKIMTKQYAENRLFYDLEYGIQDPDYYIKELHDLGLDATARLLFTGELLFSSSIFEEDGSMEALITAYDPALDATVFDVLGTLTEGRLPLEGREEILLGAWLAEDTYSSVGSFLTILTRGKGGFYEVIDVEVVGIVDPPNPNVSRSLVMIPLDVAQHYLAMEEYATEIDLSIRTKSQQRALNQFQDTLTDSSLLVIPWNELAKDYVALADAKRGASSLILLLVAIIAAVGISNTTLMSVQQRLQEIGMMRALGTKKGMLIGMFMIEAGLIGAMGSLVGLLLGGGINFYFVHYGIDFSSMIRSIDIGYRIQSTLYSAWHPQSFLIAFLFGTLLCSLVAFVATLRSLSLSIPHSLRRNI